MAQIYRWKCDICGREFAENDVGFKNRCSFRIEIPTIHGMVSDEVYAYEDTCLNCRTEISIVIENKLEDLKIKESI